MLRDPDIMILVALLLSLVVMIVTIETGLQRTPMCVLTGLAIAMMLWMAYPPAQQLPHAVGFLFWVCLSAAIYAFPPSDVAQSAPSDDELLEQFFEEKQP
jgi:hypothetical protein